MNDFSVFARRLSPNLVRGGGRGGGGEGEAGGTPASA